MSRAPASTTSSRAVNRMAGAAQPVTSAPTAGPSRWYLYEFTPSTVFAVGTAEPHGATRWRL